VRSVAVIYRRNPIVFITAEQSGITRPQDFIGRKIRSAIGADQTLRAMMAKVGIAPDQYETVYLPSDIQQFAAGEVPIWAGFINAFVLEVQRAGYKINIIAPDDYGIHFYGDVLITTDEFIAENFEVIQRFMDATLRGWRYVVEHPESAGPFVQAYHPGADPELETEKMIKSIPLVNTGEDYIGWMKPEIWEVMIETLRDQGALTQRLDTGQVYTMQFLEAIYDQ